MRSTSQGSSRCCARDAQNEPPGNSPCARYARLAWRLARALPEDWSGKSPRRCANKPPSMVFTELIRAYWRIELMGPRSRNRIAGSAKPGSGLRGVTGPHSLRHVALRQSA
jgi:hypothetical protein